MVFYAAFNCISVISRRQFMLFMFFLGFTSTRLGSEVSCPRTLPRKNPEDPVQLEPSTPGLRVKHFTTEPRGTIKVKHRLYNQTCVTNETFSKYFIHATDLYLWNNCNSRTLYLHSSVSEYS